MAPEVSSGTRDDACPLPAGEVPADAQGSRWVKFWVRVRHPATMFYQLEKYSRSS